MLKFCTAILYLMLSFESHADSKDHIGFFSPQGINSDMVANTNFGMINVMTVEQVTATLALALKSNFTIHLDFGPLLATVASVKDLSVIYKGLDGKTHRKQLLPLYENKIRVLPPNTVIEKKLIPYLIEMKKHSHVIGTVFLIDEPYLNGVSKSELERAGAEVRRLLDIYGLTKVKLGVLFASAMFDPDFATRINQAAGAYALSIDRHLETGGNFTDKKAIEDWRTWEKTITLNRLSTYDSAGNMYTGGGIPEGYDVVAFNFYLSTILQDFVHEKTLAWFAVEYPKQCGEFKGTSMRTFRKKLSFYADGPVLQGDQYRVADRKLLDSIFSCRMTATTDLLQKQIKLMGRQGNNVYQLLISESSNNGVLEFDSIGNVEKDQPEKLNESRVFDEVIRGLNFYRGRRDQFKAGLMFFTYQDEYDSSIKLNIGGAKNMPSVLHEIYGR